MDLGCEEGWVHWHLSSFPKAPRQTKTYVEAVMSASGLVWREMQPQVRGARAGGWSRRDTGKGRAAPDWLMWLVKRGGNLRVGVLIPGEESSSVLHRAVYKGRQAWKRREGEIPAKGLNEKSIRNPLPPIHSTTAVAITLFFSFFLSLALHETAWWDGCPKCPADHSLNKELTGEDICFSGPGTANEHLKTSVVSLELE